MKNFHSGGGDPLDRVVCHEEWDQRVQARKRLKVSIKSGELVLSIQLPLNRMLYLTEQLESLESLSEKLRLIAKELE